MNENDITRAETLAVGDFKTDWNAGDTHLPEDSNRQEGNSKMLYETKANLSGANFTGPLSHNDYTVWDAGNSIKEQGDWIPTIRGETTAGIDNTQVRVGKYWIYGPFIYIRGRLGNIALSGASGNIIIEGLPKAFPSSSVEAGLTISSLANWTTGNIPTLMNLSNVGAGIMRLYSGQTLMTVDSLGSGKWLAFSGIYNIA